MKKLLFLIYFIPVVTLAQKFSADRPDEVVKQDPYVSMYFADNNDYKLIESVITITKDKHNNFMPDTLNIDYYNNKGLKIKNIRYNKNKISATTEFTYDASDNLLKWHTFSKLSSTHAFYFYNKKNQLIKTNKYTITILNNKMDTVEVSRMLFKYDGEKLVQITNNSLGTDIVEKYGYEQNRLVNKTGGFISKRFLYTNKKLSSIIEYMGGVIDSTKIMGLEKFVYNSLRSINSIYKNLFRNVLFTYNNEKLEEVFLETNGNSAFLKFIISHRIDEYYTFPIKYLEQFGYDTKGNRISKKVFVNNELFSEVNYIVTYKK
ncbi:MAG: hypothetical protein IPP48_08085 [Chitinophagaceae bacterium]|nr:hypothetical protein [Chitinophagaceae bacterium]